MKIYKLLIGLFVLVTIVISITLYKSYQTLTTSYQQTESYIFLQQQKMTLENDMFNAARERSLILLSMLNEKDAFVLDDLNQKLEEKALKFIKSRAYLLTLSLTDEDKKYLNVQNQLTRKTAPLQTMVASLLIDGKFKEAKDILLRKAIPNQNKVLNNLSHLIEKEKILISNSIKSLPLALKKAGKSFVIELFLWMLSSLSLILFIILLASKKEAYHLKSVIKEREKYLVKIEDSKRVSQRLHARIKITFDAISDAIITTLEDGTIESLNPAAERLIGAHEVDIESRYLPDLFPIFDQESEKKIIHPIEEVMQSKKPTTQLKPVLLTQYSKSKLAIIYTVSPILNKQQELTGVVWVFHDMTEQIKLQKEVNYKALHDELTGLWNRYAFKQKLIRLQSDSDAFDSKHALMYLDLDQFKIVNDTAGHIAGDELLKQITYELSLLIRKSDTLARLGGDEFGLLCENCDTEHVLLMAEKIRAMIEEFQFNWEEKIFKIGVSIGVVLISKENNLIDVMGKADMACYKAKENGRNRVYLYKENDKELKNRINEMSWISKIETALREDNFVLYSQKIFAISNDEKIKDYHEILIRMKNDKGDVVYPDAFIPAAERFGLMWKIDQFVIDRTYDWLEKQPIGSVKLSINLSGQSLGNENFLHYIEKKVTQYPHLNPFIIFEITETATIYNLRVAQDFMEKLIAQGVHFSLDDFGTGLSSFAYLKNMPVSYLKIDGIFIKNMDTDSVDAAIIQSIAQVGYTLGMKIVAEFVENEAILIKLKEMGITYAQGYHIEKPKPLVNT